MYSSFRVNAIDTVAAGDAFNGGLAAALDSDLSFEDAIRWGLATAALSVTRSGAQGAMPTRDEMFAMLNR
jgi:ribokinase